MRWDGSREKFGRVQCEVWMAVSAAFCDRAPAHVSTSEACTLCAGEVFDVSLPSHVTQKLTSVSASDQPPQTLE